MKLYQSILISLSILICFSPSLSLAMQNHVININNDRDALVQRLKNKNIGLFITKIWAKNNIFNDKCISYCLLGTLILIMIILTIMSFLLPYLLINDNAVKKVLFVFLMLDSVSLGIIGMSLCCLLELHRREKYSYADSLNEIRRNHPIKFSETYKLLTYAIIKSSEDNIIETLFNQGGGFIQEDFNKIIKLAPFEMVKFLVDLGIDVNVKDAKGTPAIITAVLNNKLAVIYLLKSKDVDIGVEDAQGKTVVDYLNERPEIENAQLMIDKLKYFRKKIAIQIYKDLEHDKFPEAHAELISEYLM